MAILVVPSWYKTDSNPILGSFFREQAFMLQRHGKEVILADATFQGRADYFSKRCFKLKKFNDDGLLTYSLVEPGFGAFKRADGGYLRYYKNLKKIYKRIVADGHCIDVIHAHSYLPAGIAAVMLGKEENLPVVVTEHASAVLEKKLNDEKKELLKKVVKDSNEFVCVSHALKKSVMDLTQDEKDIIVIPNAVDHRFILRKELERDKFVFVSIGNLVQSKRFDLTIKAFAEVFKGHYNVQLKIIGDGVLKNDLEKLVNECGIADQITFLGRVSREQVVKELQNSSVFVLPSDYETFGVVYIEALACGLPVIGTKNGGAEDIITNDNGVLIEKDSLSELMQAMQCIYKENEKFDSFKIADECQKNFGEKTILKKLAGIYTNEGEKQI